MTITKWSNEQLEKHLKEQIKFLKLIYPFLDSKEYHKECIEIRPIARIKGQYIKSINLWRLDDKGIEHYRKFLNKINGQAVCIYYSSHTLDYDKETFTKDGKSNQKGYINLENSLYTQILPMDFDNIRLADFQEQIKIINNLGIETINIFTGNGFQALILLNDKVYDKDIYKKFTTMLLSRGFPVDPKIVDASRVLRMPYTFNCKEFDKNRYKVEKPIAKPTLIYDITDKRYSVEDVFGRIESLKIKDKSYVINNKNIDGKTQNNGKKYIRGLGMDKQKKSNSGANTEVIEYKNINTMYPRLNFKALPEPIQLMLMQTPENYRNSAMMFLIPFLRNKIGLSLNEIIETMKVWNCNCKPPQDEEFIITETKRIFNYDYKGTGAYTCDLAKEFGYIQFDEYKLKDNIIIPNQFFINYHKLHKSAVKIYLMMKLFEDRDNIDEWNMELISKVSKVSKSTVKRYLKELVDIKLIDKKKGNRKKGIKDKYYISIFWDKKLGFTKFNPCTIQSMIYSELDSLNDNEIKVYTYIYYMLNGSNNKCYASQSYIGEKVGLTRQRISEITDSLVSKRRLQKNTFTGKDKLQHCIYYLRG